ncbi:MAG TPA: methylated-DNA--[protein]-cysteine S-methyltransferase [Solirubrobacteraceae bacterium]
MTVDDHICRFETALGVCGVRWNERGITNALLPKERVLRDASDADPDDTPEPIRRAIKAIVELLEGEPSDLRSIALDERGVDEFQRRVYAATREIEPGETASYGEIARAIAAPAAAREVGAALGRNPYPIIVPCHRVLAADGTLHGFSAPGGITTKRRMLEIEGAPGFMQRALFA